MSAQSKNPTKVMPAAVGLTVLITATLSILAAVSLTGTIFIIIIIINMLMLVQQIVLHI
jgi:hypothetical protein